MGRWTRRAATILIALLLTGCAWIQAQSERIGQNRVISPSLPGCPDPDPESGCALAQRYFIADLHADSLLWGRDLRREAEHGQTDFARLAAGGVNLQILATPNRTPLERALGDDHCASAEDFDTSELLFFVNEPLRPATWASPRSRAFRQAQRWAAWSGTAAEGDRPRRLLVRGDIAARGAWGNGTPPSDDGPYTLLALEGLNWVHSNRAWLVREIDALIEAGYRMVALTHRYSNALAGASEDCDDLRSGHRRGLTPLGELAIDTLINRGVVIDLAHASSATISDVTQRVQRAKQVGKGAGLVVSHAGVQRRCPGGRNLGDEDLQRIVLADGVIGIGYWAAAACWDPGEGDDDAPEKARRAVTHSFLAALIVLRDGALARRYEETWGRPFDPTRHLALGSDFDGAVLMRFDATAVPRLLSALKRAACPPDLSRSGAEAVSDVEILCPHGEMPFASEEVLARIAGGNVARVIAGTLRETYDASSADR